MADLITHAAVGYLLCSAHPSARRHAAPVVAGCVLPDLLSRLPSLTLRLIHDHLRPLPEVLLYIWEPVHMPLGMVLLSYGLAQLFPPAERRAVGWALLAGMGLHLGLDLLQDHLGVGYMLLFPLSTEVYELGLIGSESTVPLAPVLGLLALLRWRQLQPPPHQPGAG